MVNRAYSQAQVVIDEGLRSYMLKVYNFMAGGLGVTGLAAWLVANNETLLKLFFDITPTGVSLSVLGWIAFLAPLVMVFAFGWVVNSGTSRQVQLLFWSYAAVMGIGLTPIFLVYTASSLARVFLITAGAFGALICSFLNTRNLHYRGVISGLISASVFSAAFILICFILSGFSVSVYYLIMAAVNLTLGAIAGIAAKNLR